MPRTKKAETTEEKKQKKTTTKKVVAKASLKAEAAVAVEKKPATKKAKQGSLTIEVVDVSGKSAGVLSLPEAIFGAKINKALIAQSIRVYLANQRQGNAHTKTRGEVTGSTRKIYRQKGTGRARHGGVRAPIFVHGGVAHGPRVHDFSLSMPEKMRRRALFGALSTKRADGKIKIVDGLETLEPKTRIMAGVMKAFGEDEKKRRVLLVVDAKQESVSRAGRNLKGVTLRMANQLNTYEVLQSRTIVFMKPAIAVLEKTFVEKKDAH